MPTPSEDSQGVIGHSGDREAKVATRTGPIGPSRDPGDVPATPFDDLEPHDVLCAKDIADRLHVARARCGARSRAVSCGRAGPAGCASSRATRRSGGARGLSPGGRPRARLRSCRRLRGRAAALRAHADAVAVARAGGRGFMTPHPVHPGIDVRRSIRPDGSVAETFTVRWKEPDGRKPRRMFDSLQDALDYKAKRRSAKAGDRGAAPGARRPHDARRVLRGVERSMARCSGCGGRSWWGRRFA